MSSEKDKIVFSDVSGLLGYINEIKYQKNSGKREYRQEVKSNVWEYCKYMDGFFFNDKKKKLKEIADILQKVYDGEILNVMINVTVRTGKSYILSMFISFWLGNRPTTPIMRITNTKDLYDVFSKDIKKIITSKRYLEIFPNIELKNDDKGTKRWSLTLAKQKSYFGGGMDGTITGQGSELAVIDDPVKGIVEGRNDRRMEKIYDIYKADIVTRLDPNKDTPIIILHTRWNNNDLSGKLEKNDGLASINGSRFHPETGKELKGKWHKYMYPALIDNESFDENIWSTKKLLERRMELKRDGQEDIWYLVFQQNVYKVDKKERPFMKENLKFFNKEMFLTMVTDAFGDSVINYSCIIDPADSGSNNLAIFFYVKIFAKYYVVDIIYTDKELGDEIVDEAIYSKFTKYSVKQILHEKDGLGNVFGKLLVEKLKNNDIDVGRKSFSSENINKIQRIMTNVGKIKEEIYWLEEKEQDSHYKKAMSDICAFNRKHFDKDRLDAPDLAAALVSSGKHGKMTDSMKG